MGDRQFFLATFIVFILASVSCENQKRIYDITAVSESSLIRESESIEIWLDAIPDFSLDDPYKLMVTDKNGNRIPNQSVDINQDSITDYLIFQTDFEPNETKKFKLAQADKPMKQTEHSIRTFCRIVLERMDDFAWENDKVAFRSYGPKCQELFEEGNPAGLISSGIDCWTKRVDYPIINRWYENDKNGKSYHEDHGEGLDSYHVGTTRGCGGTALWHDGEIVLSENFIHWKVLANGPIRSVFELSYAPVQVGDNSVTEKKRITLDLGSNLYHCEVKYTSEKPVDTMAVGIALHQGKGEITSSKEKGYMTYWEPMEDSFLGTAVLTDPSTISDMKLDKTIHEDESLNNIWINSKVGERKVNYWSGFGWKKSGNFKSMKEWEKYVSNEAAKKSSPIKIKITKD